MQPVRGASRCPAGPLAVRWLGLRLARVPGPRVARWRPGARSTARERRLGAVAHRARHRDGRDSSRLPLARRARQRDRLGRRPHAARASRSRPGERLELDVAVRAPIPPGPLPASRSTSSRSIASGSPSSATRSSRVTSAPDRRRALAVAAPTRRLDGLEEPPCPRRGRGGRVARPGSCRRRLVAASSTRTPRATRVGGSVEPRAAARAAPRARRRGRPAAAANPAFARRCSARRSSGSSSSADEVAGLPAFAAARRRAVGLRRRGSCRRDLDCDPVVDPAEDPGAERERDDAPHAEVDHVPARGSRPEEERRADAGAAASAGSPSAGSTSVWCVVAAGSRRAGR